MHAELLVALTQYICGISQWHSSLRYTQQSTKKMLNSVDDLGSQ